MHSHRRSLRAVAFAVLALAGAAACAEVPVTSQIYQQRGADGSIVLTDRPSPKATTERTWLLQHEDAGAAQRAIDVRRQAEAVSERIQRQIEAQERRAADQDLVRMRTARVDRSDGVDDGIGDGYGYGDGYGFGYGLPLSRQFGHHHRGVGYTNQPGFHRQGPSAGMSHGPRSGAGPGYNQR